MVKLELSFGGTTLMSVVRDSTPEIVESSKKLADNMSKLENDELSKEIQKLSKSKDSDEALLSHLMSLVKIVRL